ncbi:cytochrome b561 domain-containing protein [Bosea sp. R86505]|uniref:cytochrome b561 domain-containing protein n=1 Tax=Bosea sp. R86505 TaxID=3101710 RepID=UPI00366B1AA2
MLDWLTLPIDATRQHEVAGLVAWHGRLMVLAWAVLCPLGVLVARFFKIAPGQDWPHQLDDKRWWRSHLTLQYSAGFAMLLGFWLIWSTGRTGQMSGLHAWLGYAVLAFGALQFLAGWLRGSKGGPTQQQLRGDHYDMTPRRLLFEYVHKSVGYLALLLAVAAVLSGLWTANAPRWMWIALPVWWAGLLACFAILQRQGRAIDTYQAIWGPDVQHPGNRRKPIGIGLRRPQ